jgi:hypothetical protein
MLLNDAFQGYTVYAMVHKLKDGSGGPARVFALPTSDTAQAARASSAGIVARSNTISLITLISVWTTTVSLLQ